jgi:hypothetical protein
LARYKKGQSGNPKGRPKGSGKKQRSRQREEHEEVIYRRMELVLIEIDEWHTQRVELLTEYMLGSERFPINLDT